MQKSEITEDFLIEVIKNRDSILHEIEENIHTLISYMEGCENEAEEIRSFFLPQPSAFPDAGVPSSGEIRDLSDLYEKFEKRKKHRETEMQELINALLERREKVERVWICYMVLPHHERTILKLYYKDGRKMEDIADELHCSVKTIFNHRNRALEMLKERFESGLSPELFLLTNKKGS